MVKWTNSDATRHGTKYELAIYTSLKGGKYNILLKLHSRCRSTLTLAKFLNILPYIFRNDHHIRAQSKTAHATIHAKKGVSLPQPVDKQNWYCLTPSDVFPHWLPVRGAPPPQASYFVLLYQCEFVSVYQLCVPVVDADPEDHLYDKTLALDHKRLKTFRRSR